MLAHLRRGYLQDGDDEVCDDGIDQHRHVRNNCGPAAMGDEVLRTDLQSGQQGHEGCDDGNTEPGDGCSASADRSCGDGVVNGIEQCDDANEYNLDACRNDCRRATCGDGVVRTDISEGEEGYEACDDGNQENDDACRTNCVAATCGDNIRRTDLVPGDEGYEACDDGNDSNTDACTNQCVAARCGAASCAPISPSVPRAMRNAMTAIGTTPMAA